MVSGHCHRRLVQPTLSFHLESVIILQKVTSPRHWSLGTAKVLSSSGSLASDSEELCVQKSGPGLSPHPHRLLWKAPKEEQWHMVPGILGCILSRDNFNSLDQEKWPLGPAHQGFSEIPCGRLNGAPTPKDVSTWKLWMWPYLEKWTFADVITLLVSR